MPRKQATSRNGFILQGVLLVVALVVMALFACIRVFMATDALAAVKWAFACVLLVNAMGAVAEMVGSKGR